jgi:hypothetical protein
MPWNFPMIHPSGDKLKTGPARADRAVRLLAWCSIWFACSCADKAVERLTLGPRSEPRNVFRAADVLPPEMKRVAVLPVAVASDDSALADGKAALEPVLYAELRKTTRFEIVEVTAEQVRNLTGRNQCTAEEQLPPDFLKRVQAMTHCDAVLFSRLTHYRAYPPLVIGWSLKLVEVKTSTIFWAVDEVFDASNSFVNNAARFYALEQAPETSAPADSRTVFNSPRRFGQFSASQVAATLPARGMVMAKVPLQPADKQTERKGTSSQPRP